MASSASIVSNSSIPPGIAQSSISPQSNGAGRTTMKTTSKGADGGRKQSPADGASRRAPQPKAWTSGTNPLTQKSPAPNQSNGSLSQPKSSAGTRSTIQKEATFSERDSNSRLRFIMMAATGTVAVITTKAGDKFEGAFSSTNTSSSPTIVSLKMTRRLYEPQSAQTNGVAPRESALTGSGPEHAMEFDIKDIADISISDLSLPQVTNPQNGMKAPGSQPSLAAIANRPRLQLSHAAGVERLKLELSLADWPALGTSPNFQTDADISGNLSLRERELKPWVPEGNTGPDLGLESSGPVVWDQFETNQRLFGMKTTYDENHYTIPLDRNASSYKSKEADAARLAREIEGNVGENAHMREERGQANEEAEEDEESKYSGVQRNFTPLATGGSNVYTPPARRPPTSGPTVAGAPFDPAIISSQISRPDGVKAAVPKVSSKGLELKGAEPAIPEEKAEALNTSVSHGEANRTKPGVSAASTAEPATASGQEDPRKPRSINTSVSPNRQIIEGDATENVEEKVLEKFRQFATAEKAKLTERRRAQASQDRTAKLNDLKRFSSNFKLKTPIPVDLVGILAKDPAKQEQIVEKARRETDEAKSTTTSPLSGAGSDTARTPSRVAKIAKFDPSTIPPPLVDRQTFMRDRGGLPTSARGDRQGQQQGFGRGGPTAFSQRPAAVQNERKQVPLQSIPAPIPLHEGRVPPSGPMADSGMSSPQRSNLHTPTSTVSTRFNVKALEFRPSANAAVFNPGSLSNAPSSPISMQRTASVSRAASPSAFFGSRKPIPANKRPKMSDYFNPIKRMKTDEERKKAALKEAGKEYKDLTSNGGIPHAYQTGPRWDVNPANSEKTWDAQAIENKTAPTPSPHQSRSNSTQHIPYHHQVPPHLQNGSQGIPQIATPQFSQQHQNPTYPHQFEDNHQRIPMQISSSTSTMYTSPRPQPGQMVYPSPMAHPAQLAYGQPQQYYGQGNQGHMQMRQYGGPQPYMHSPGNQLAAPMMVQQPSSGPYMAVPQYQQAQMYSPSPAHVYPQQNGYPSPGRGATMMMQQGSQQGYHGGQQSMYNPQQGQMNMYGQQGGQMPGMRPGFGGQQGNYGSGPLQPHPYQQRAMSSGYGQVPTKMMQQQMQPNHGPPPNAPQQPSAYGAAPADGS